ncbi:MAG: hypothetical protein A3F72_13515 [Bacteroidetes bacterium RIFCSPLOWO2_12_FULL_35_15]|nr:MAG: hypothetical protein A3F72_13515 [Bacteroidetes bacterium RIFCSPLOWO2_12_FULL_35_15]
MTFAQNVGINSNGATPADCSMLDIVSTTKGLLIPRVVLTDVTTWAPLTGTAVDGVIVYSTANPTGGSGTGYYYWSTVATAHWVNLIDNLNPGTPWLTIGNTGLTSPAAPATYGTSLIASTENWMGHTDAKDIVFGTDTKERMRIMKTSGFVGVGTAAPSTLFHIDGGTGSTTQTIATITGNSLTTGTGLAITANALTSGSAITVATSSAITGNLISVTGSNASFSGNGVKSDMQGTSGATYAIYGLTASTTGRGVYGYATATTGTNWGGYGRSASNDGYGIVGYHSSTTAATNAAFLDRIAGVFGQTDADNTIGVIGITKTHSVSQSIGVWGFGSSYSADIGVLGIGNAQTYTALAAGAGGYFIGSTYGSYSKANTAASGNGVIGAGNNLTPTVPAGGSGGAFTSTNVGVAGYGDATAASWGVYGKSIAASGGLGVYGLATINNGDGVNGDNTAAAGAGTGFGGYFTTLQTGGCALGGSLGGYFYYAGTGTSGITNYASGYGVAGNNSAAAGIGVIGFGNNTSTYMNPNSAGAGGVFSGTRYGSVSSTTNTATAGTGYKYGQSYSAAVAEMQTSVGVNTSLYHFGVHGSNNDYGAAYGLRTGGVLGNEEYTGAWACLGYQSSTTTNRYGCYSTATAYNGTTNTNTGFMEGNNTVSGIGNGSYGGVIGSWTRGEVMGHISAGELFASYNLGNAYTSGYQAEIVTLAEKRVATYSVTSTEVKVYNDGIGKLSMGKTRVNFETSFSELIEDSRPVVTITPMGQCNGIYISNVDSKGFDIVELNNGSSNVEFSYIVIGKRIDGANKPELPEALAKKDFDQKMKGVMFNESNLEQSALPVWWDGKQIRFDAAPEKQASNIIKAEVRKPEEKKNRKPNKD